MEHLSWPDAFFGASGCLAFVAVTWLFLRPRPQPLFSQRRSAIEMLHEERMAELRRPAWSTKTIRSTEVHIPLTPPILNALVDLGRLAKKDDDSYEVVLKDSAADDFMKKVDEANAGGADAAVP